MLKAFCRSWSDIKGMAAGKKCEIRNSMVHIVYMLLYFIRSTIDTYEKSMASYSSTALICFNSSINSFLLRQDFSILDSIEGIKSINSLSSVRFLFEFLGKSMFLEQGIDFGIITLYITVKVFLIIVNSTFTIIGSLSVTSYKYSESEFWFDSLDNNGNSNIIFVFSSFNNIIATFLISRNIPTAKSVFSLPPMFGRRLMLIVCCDKKSSTNKSATLLKS